MRIALLAVLALSLPALAEAVEPAGLRDARPLGSLEPTLEPVADCPADHACLAFRVACPGVRLAARGELGVAPPLGVPRGLVMLFSGGLGFEWYTDDYGSPLADQLRLDGFALAQVRWIDGWFLAARDERAGFGALACRPATTIAWVHDVLGVVPGVAPGRCGFCVTGQSGGAMQVSYALSHYGLDRIVDADVPTGGPPSGALRKGCMRVAGEEAYWYTDFVPELFDRAYGFGADGPCARQIPLGRRPGRRTASRAAGTTTCMRRRGCTSSTARSTPCCRTRATTSAASSRRARPT